MLPFLQLILAMVIIIAVAKLGGYLSYRLGQPAVAGEVLAGMILGPSVVNFLEWPMFTDQHLGETITMFAEIGVLLLLFIAGLDLNLHDLAESGKVAVFAGVIGFALPLAMGFGLATAFSSGPQEALFFGLLLAPTSVSISAQTLMELKVLRSRVGVGLLGAAIVDDTIVVLGVSIFLALVGGAATAGWVHGITILWQMMLYLLIAAVAGLWLLPRISRLAERLPVSQGVIAFTFITLLLYAWAAESLGNMAAIFGAFLAGLFLARTELKEQIEEDFSKLAYGIFVPIFFVNVGLEANVRQLTVQGVWFLAAVVIVAVVSKVLGVALAGRLSGLGGRQAMQLGVGMIPRGEVVLIVASLGIAEGLIGSDIMATAVGMVVVTTLITPPVLRALFSQPQPEPRPDQGAL